MRGLWDLSTLDRVQRCARTPHSLGTVELGVSENGTGIRGVQRCASIHVCPLCQPKIRAGRAGEIREAARVWVEGGGDLLFLTATVPHDQGDDLDALWRSVSGVWSSIWRHRRWKSLCAQLGLEGYTRTIETNHGGNGWHPHVHALLFLERPLSRREARLVRGVFSALWCEAVEREGWRRPSGQHGVRVDQVDKLDALAAYLGKIDAELARADLKEGRDGSRSPLALLAAAIGGDAQALALWTEFERASKGKLAMTWSRGLKRRLGVEEVTDQELAEAEVEFQTVATIHGGAWWRICSMGRSAELLDAVLIGNEARALKVLRVCRVPASAVQWREDVRRSVPLSRVLDLTATTP